MASGDITKVQELGRFSLPGGGNTTAGVQVQNKVLVWGVITATYVAAGINPAAAGSLFGASGTLAKTFGVENIDFCELTLTVTDGQVADKDNVRTFVLDRGSDLIFGLEGIGQAQATLPTDGDAVELSYLVVGDSSSYTELT